MSVKATDTAFSADELLADERNNDSSLQVGVALCCPCAKRTIQFGPRLLISMNSESEDPSSCRKYICWVMPSDSHWYTCITDWLQSSVPRRIQDWVPWVDFSIHPIDPCGYPLDAAQAQALLIMLAGLMLERMMPSGYCTVCTFTYAMLVVMYLHRCKPWLKPCDRKAHGLVA